MHFLNSRIAYMSWFLLQMKTNHKCRAHRIHQHNLSNHHKPTTSGCTGSCQHIGTGIESKLCDFLSKSPKMIPFIVGFYLVFSPSRHSDLCNRTFHRISCSYRNIVFRQHTGKHWQNCSRLRQPLKRYSCHRNENDKSSRQSFSSDPSAQSVILSHR